MQLTTTTAEIKNVWNCTFITSLCLQGVSENILSSKTEVIVVKILGVVVQNIAIRAPGILCTLILQDAILEGKTIEIFATLRIPNHCLIFWQRKFCLSYRILCLICCCQWQQNFLTPRERSK